jgi:hypothetical protein
VVAKMTTKMKDRTMNNAENESGRPEFPINLGGGEVQVIEYTSDQRRAVEPLQAYGLLGDYDAAMQRIDTDIDREPGSPQMWIDVFPVKGQRLMLAATLIYLPHSDECHGGLAVAQYVGKLKRASAVLYRWAEKNAMRYVEELMEGATAGGGRSELN